MKIFNFLPLNSDHRGATYENDYLSVEENADIRGCVFFDCTFDTEESFGRALEGGGICINCEYSQMGYSKVVYVNAESAISLEVDEYGSFGILGGGRYIIFSDSDFILDEYDLLSEITRYLREEAVGLQRKTLDSRTFARININYSVGVDVSSDVVENDYASKKDFGVLKKWGFDASESFYPREDGDIYYSAFIYIPPHDAKNIYVFGEDVVLGEVACWGGDIAEIVKELFPDKAELAEDLYKDDEISTFRDAELTLEQYLSHSQRKQVRNAYLGLEDEDVHTHNYIKSQLFRVILDRTSSSFSTIHGQKVGLLLDKSLLILDYDKVAPPLRDLRKIKFVTA